jgi:hypothetical protein
MKWCSGRDSNPGPRLERPLYLTGLYYRSWGYYSVSYHEEALLIRIAIWKKGVRATRPDATGLQSFLMVIPKTPCCAHRIKAFL